MKKSEFIKRLEELERKVKALEAREINPLDKYFPQVEPYRHEPYRHWRYPWRISPWIEPNPGPSWPTNPWTISPGTTWCGPDINGTVTTAGNGADIRNVGLY